MKYVITGAALMLLLIAFFAYGNHQGRAHVQAKWDADKAVRAIAANEAIMARLAENQAIETARTSELKKIKESYEKRINSLGQRPASRLYIPRPADCHAATLPTGSTNPSGTADPTGSIGLPPRIEENLYLLMDKADAIGIRLTALQEACK